MRRLPITVLLAVAAALALVFAGCGDDEGEAPAGKKGGTLKVISAGDVDSLDPGYHYYQYDYMALDLPTHRGLYGWKPEDIEPSPDLAEGQPEVSEDGRTVTVRIKSGVRFAPPVNREVKSADVKYAVERGFNPAVGNAYAGSYFADIEGAKELQDGKAEGLSGIETPDDRTVVFKLTKPVGVIAFPQALALPLTAPVPKEYAQKYDEGKTSTYGQHVVETGPYMLPKDKSGKVTKEGYSPGEKITLIRNPNWNADNDFRPAFLDRIEFLGGNDLTVGSRQILTGRDRVSGDYAAPPTPVLKQALSRYKDQTSILPSQSLRFIALNPKRKPLDDVNVRKAISAAIDENALRLTRGGEAIGRIGTHIIPPDMPGFDEAGGDKGPGVDFLANPGADLQLAQEYMRKAGYESGRYDGGEDLLMVGDNEAPASKTGEAVQAQIEELGFKLNYRQVTHETMLSKFCNVPKEQPAICPNLGWGKDFFDSQSMIDPLFNGANLVPVNNVNYGQLDDPKINAAIDRARQLTDPDARARAWGELDRQITELALFIPWLWDNQVNIRSENVKTVVNKFNSSWDIAYTSLE